MMRPKHQDIKIMGESLKLLQELTKLQINEEITLNLKGQTMTLKRTQ